jgi:hypothetical protein
MVGMVAADFRTAGGGKITLRAAAEGCGETCIQSGLLFRGKGKYCCHGLFLPVFSQRAILSHSTRSLYIGFSGNGRPISRNCASVFVFLFLLANPLGFQILVYRAVNKIHNYKLQMQNYGVSFGND